MNIFSEGYTSISVREPLANIIAQTKQSQPTRPLTDSHYATVSDDSGILVDIYFIAIYMILFLICIKIYTFYNTDEMYAAIDEQEKVYTSGSETYAQIQPTTSDANRIVQNESLNLIQSSSRGEESHVPAPQPPSVDSLRHVAHAHSRQGEIIKSSLKFSEKSKTIHIYI